ncbi:MAG: thiol-disulfide oxidoreductase [Flavipsychrobacter sp.]|jgi:predicted DCC family thiol-disulfide oxidoreductase YuxK|nr:thiol-disulfide oxidoreductase [Flavipsychrobacter sp.]
MNLPDNNMSSPDVLESLSNHRPVVFFDGECNLCNGGVQFIIKRDKEKRFLFAPLQSAIGAKAKELSGGADSFILFYKGRYYIKSSAALHTARLMGGLWPLLYIGIIIPRILRNWVYEFLARNRYKWFGKRNECMIPTPELKERFLS